MYTEDMTAGAMVPAVKQQETREETPQHAFEPPPEAPGGDFGGSSLTRPLGVLELSELDKDFSCPICMQIIKDAFLTACGHSFCFMCITTHLHNKCDCPCCGQYLTSSQIFPNFALDKLLKKASACKLSKGATLGELFSQALHQGCEVSVKEIDKLLGLLTVKKRKLEQEEAERNMQVLMDFLQCLRRQKVEELKEIQYDIQYIKEDLAAVERNRIELCRARERYSGKLRMNVDGSSPVKSGFPSIDKKCSGLFAGLDTSGVDGKAQFNSHAFQRKDALIRPSSNHFIHSGLAVARKKRVHAQFNDLQECYLQKRRHLSNQSYHPDENHTNVVRREGYTAGLANFQSVLSSFTQYSRLRVIAELRQGGHFDLANIVSSIEFDRDDELFATAGVSRRIKVFDFASVVNDPMHCPVVEMTTRSKLSCLSWNRYSKNQIASSDYEGIVTVWDVTTRQSVMEYEEHEKRAWSVDFSHTEPSMLVSGSDDCKVKVWCTQQESSVLNIDMKANICCVKYNPGSSVHIAVGSADHYVHYYDLRNVSRPLHVFSGHQKTVSYVKFMSNDELASASTDSTIRLWDLKENLPVRTFRGHTNEKNFVGLAVNSEYIACGSEENEVFVYHKEILRPMTSHRFGLPGRWEDSGDDSGTFFISAVCWKSDSPTILTANSLGTIKVLVLAA